MIRRTLLEAYIPYAREISYTTKVQLSADRGTSRTARGGRARRKHRFAALRPLIPTEAEKVADKGYQGIAKLYQNSTIPIKKPKNKPLKSKQSDLIDRYRNDGLASNMSIADAKSSGLPNSDTVVSTKTMAKS